MVVRGRVQNGVVVLDEHIRLPDGQEVIVLVGDTGPRGHHIDTKLHSVLDIPTVSVGSLLRPATSVDDLLGEMLEGRP